MIFLYAYLFVTLLVAIRLGWHMLARLDAYDWHHNKAGIWGKCLLSCIAWPLLFIKPANLVDPSSLFQGRILDSPARQREHDQLWDNPPPCGPWIRYRQGQGRYGDKTYGEFIFKADDVKLNLIEHLQETPYLEKDNEGAILNWLNQRDESLSEPTDVPKAWWRFQFVADDLVRSGNGTVYCLQCDKEIKKEHFVIDDDCGKPGWNFNNLACPSGHNLLVVESMHLYMG